MANPTHKFPDEQIILHPEEGLQLALELLLTAQEPIHVNWQLLMWQPLLDWYLHSSLQELSAHKLEQEVTDKQELVQPPAQELQELYVDAQYILV